MAERAPDAPKEVTPAEVDSYSSQTVDLLFDLMKDADDRAIAQVRSFEARAAQALGAGTILLGLAGLGPFTASMSVQAKEAVLALLAVAVTAYVAAATAALWLLLPTFVYGYSRARLWGTHRDYPERDIKVALMTAISADAEDNEDRLSTKSKLAQAAIAGVAAEGIFVGVALLVARAFS